MESFTDTGVSGLVRPGERIDDLQRNGLRILQDPARFCFGMDAVLLSAYVQMKKARRALDLGTGNGIIPILLSDRTDCAHLTGLEIQPESASLADRSVALNGLQDRIAIVQGDIREADCLFAAASFDFITCNPPYRPVGRGLLNGKAGTRLHEKPGGLPDVEAQGLLNGKADRHLHENTGRLPSGKAEGLMDGKPGRNPEEKGGWIPDPRAAARHELLCTFDDVVRVTARLLRPGGHFYLVHRPARLAEIMAKLCAAGLEPKRMRLVHPHADKAPNLVLLDCVRGGAPELRVEPPLIVYEDDGTYTADLLQIYGA